MRASRECAARRRRQYLFLDRDRNQSAVVTMQATAAAMIIIRPCVMHSKLDQELREPSRSQKSLGGQIDAGSLPREPYHKSDSSTRKELEKERGSADEVTIRIRRIRC
jgi:hypothetical protein